MKAKTYYIDPEALRSPSRLTSLECEEGQADGDVAVRLIRVSDLDKMIERAAKAAYDAHWLPHGVPKGYRWSDCSKVEKAAWRTIARAAYAAGGLLS